MIPLNYSAILGGIIFPSLISYPSLIKRIWTCFSAYKIRQNFLSLFGNIYSFYPYVNIKNLNVHVFEQKSYFIAPILILVIRQFKLELSFIIYPPIILLSVFIVLKLCPPDIYQELYIDNLHYTYTVSIYSHITCIYLCYFSTKFIRKP